MVRARGVLAAIAVVAASIAVFEIASRRGDAPPPAAPCPPAAPPPTIVTVAPKPATPPPPSFPTEAVPCAVMVNGHDTLQLVADGSAAALCMSNGECVDDGLRPTTRPTAKPSPDAAHVDGDRICTGSRCDPLGARVRAAVRDGIVGATSDHGIIVVEAGTKTQLWNRAADRLIALPRPAPKPGSDGDITSVEILGARVLVVREWDPNITPPDGSWPLRGAIVDASGDVTSHVFIASDATLAITDLGGDRFIITDGSGGFALVVNGAPTWYGDLAAWDASAAGREPGGDRAVWWGQHVPVAFVALDRDPPVDSNQIDGTPDGTVELAHAAYKWCDYAACHVGRIDISIHTDRRGRETQSLTRASDHELPACTSTP